MPGSLAQRLRADELMDDPALDPATFHAVLGDLELHHDEHPLEGGERLQEAEDHRHRDVVGQVGNQGGGLGVGQLAHVHRVRVHEGEAVRVCRCEPAHGGGKGGREARVHLDRGDVSRFGQEGEGERAETGAHLDHGVLDSHTGEADDALDRVGVDDEVLPPLLRRAQAEPGRYRAQLGKLVGDTFTPVGPPQTFQVITLPERNYGLYR